VEIAWDSTSDYLNHDFDEDDFKTKAFIFSLVNKEKKTFKVMHYGRRIVRFDSRHGPLFGLGAFVLRLIPTRIEIAILISE
jgi:hypothetical protein